MVVLTIFRRTLQLYHLSVWLENGDRVCYVVEVENPQGFASCYNSILSCLQQLILPNLLCLAYLPRKASPETFDAILRTPKCIFLPKSGDIAIYSIINE